MLMPRRLRMQPLLRIFFEFLCAMMAAKIVSLPLVLVLCRRAPWIHRHATNRVGDRFIAGAGLLGRHDMDRRNGFHEALRVFPEFSQTVLAAKIIRMSVVLLLRSLPRIDGHSANWVGNHTVAPSTYECGSHGKLTQESSADYTFRGD